MQKEVVASASRDDGAARDHVAGTRSAAAVMFHQIQLSNSSARRALPGSRRRKRKRAIVPFFSDGGRVVFRFLPRTSPRERSAAWRTLISAHCEARRASGEDAHAPRRSTAATFHPAPEPFRSHSGWAALASLIQAAYAAFPPLPTCQLWRPLIVGADGCPGRPGRMLAKHPRRRRVPLRSSRRLRKTPSASETGSRYINVGPVSMKFQPQ